MRKWCVCRGNLQRHFYKFVTPVSSAVDLHNKCPCHNMKCMQIIRTRRLFLECLLPWSTMFPTQPFYCYSCVWSTWRLSIYLSKLSRDKVRKDDLSIYLVYGLDAFERYYLLQFAKSVRVFEILEIQTTWLQKRRALGGRSRLMPLLNVVHMG